MNFSFEFGEGKASVSGGCGILTIVFIILKLTGVIAWKWWVVLLPLIIGGGLILVMMAVLGIIAIRENRKKKKGVF